MEHEKRVMVFKWVVIVLLIWVYGSLCRKNGRIDGYEERESEEIALPCPEAIVVTNRTFIYTNLLPSEKAMYLDLKERGGIWYTESVVE